MTRSSKGFTLIELMIVVVIIGILSAVAYPSYSNHVRKTKRAEAKTRLLQVAQLEERFFTENNTYTVNIAGLLGTAGNVYSSDTNAASSGYQITIAAGVPGIASSFTLTAARQGSQVDDTRCGDLVLQHTGAKQLVNAVGGTVAECWN